MVREARRRRELFAELDGWLGGAGATHLIRAPLRICPLGAHIDHQGGTVCGTALDRHLMLAFRVADGPRVRLRSLDLGGQVEFDLDAIPPPIPGDWGNFARGAAWAMGQAYPLRRGFDGVLRGALPIGGLSSSAAVATAYLRALELANEVSLNNAERMHLVRQIENGYVGVRSGLLDPCMVLCSRADALCVLDCATEQVDWVPTPPAARFDWVVVYCGLSRALTGTDYNRRVEECQAAGRELLRLAGRPVPESPRLSKVDPSIHAAHGADLPPTLSRRAAHYFSEQARVLQGIEAWRAGDLAAFGALMTESGRSSVDQYECGGTEMTSLWSILAATPGVLGARFSGAGFKGSCLALAEPGWRTAIVASLAEHYRSAQPHVAQAYEVHFCGPSDAVEVS